MNHLHHLCFLLFLSYSANVFCTSNELKSVEETIAKTENLIKSYENIDDKNCVIKQLSLMEEIDQVLRETISSNENESILFLVHEQNKKNAERLKKILNKYFWLKISEFGSEADKQAWLIAQHADHDLDFQHKVLFILEQMVALQESAPKHYAYLYDRISVKYSHFGVKQKYGTQAMMRDNKPFILDFEGNEAELNKRREKIGLQPIEQYLDILNEQYCKAKS